MIKLEASTGGCDAGAHGVGGEMNPYIVTIDGLTTYGETTGSALPDYSLRKFLQHTCNYCGERWYTLIKE